MRSVNRITLIGNVGADPEVRTTGSGQRLAKLSLATTERWSGRSGQREERTDWHRLAIWGALAEFVEQHVRKGSHLYVEGSVRYDSREKEDGTKTYWTEVNVRELVLLDRRDDVVSTTVGRRAAARAPLGAPDADLPF